MKKHKLHEGTIQLTLVESDEEEIEKKLGVTDYDLSKEKTARAREGGVWNQSVIDFPADVYCMVSKDQLKVTAVFDLKKMQGGIDIENLEADVVHWTNYLQKVLFVVSGEKQEALDVFNSDEKPDDPEGDDTSYGQEQ